MYIYLTQNLINGKIYIGQSTKDSDKSINYYGSGRRFLKAIKKYGKENFQKIILKDNIICKIELGIFERFYISLYCSQDNNIGYNVQNGGIQTIDYTKVKRDYSILSERLKTIERTEEWKNNISKSLTGKKLSEERKQKISLSHKGKTGITKIFKIYDENSNVMFEIDGKFNDFCKKHNLPSSVLNKSIQQNGRRIYNSLQNVKEEYKKYQGWFALSFNKELR